MAVSRKVRETLFAAGAEEGVLDALDTSKVGVRRTLANVVRVLELDTRWAGRLFFDLRALELRAEGASTAITDDDVCSFRVWLGRVYGVDVGKDLAHDAIVYVSRQRRRDLLLEELDALAWDKKLRADHWLSDFAGVPDSPLVRAYSRRFLISAVARAYAAKDRPGIGAKVDTVLTLAGGQGAKKSTLLRTLAGDRYFADSAFDPRNKDAYLAIRRPWIYECAELTSLSRREAEEIKSFLTSQSDNFRAPYERINRDVPRQGVFVASTNHDTFLNDPSGSRRFWPVRVGEIKPDELAKVRDQLWAEAVHAYRAGEVWWLTPDEERLRMLDADDYSVEQPLADKLREWLPSVPFSLTDAMEGVGLKIDQLDKMKRSVSEALLSIGCTRRRVGAERLNRWFPPAEDPKPADQKQTAKVQPSWAGPLRVAPDTGAIPF